MLIKPFFQLFDFEYNKILKAFISVIYSYVKCRMVFIAIKFEKPITLSPQKVNAFVNSCLDKGAILLESL